MLRIGATARAKSDGDWDSGTSALVASRPEIEMYTNGAHLVRVLL